MATGISGREKLSADALLASIPGRDPHPLPAASAMPVMHYPNRLTEKEVLEYLPSNFIIPGQKKFVRATGPNNKLMLCDNLFGLHELINSGRRATLIYLDPPYNTGMEFHSRDLAHAYKDQFGTAHYVEFMRRRLILMRELLTDDGSIYVHIGHQMVSHLKVVLDEIFGPQNFRNIITRKKCSSKNFTKHSFSNTNDYILFYTKTHNYKWNKPGEKPDDAWIDKEYTKVDAKGRYKLVPIHAPGTRQGATGEAWRDMMPPPGKHWQYVPSKLEELDQAGEIHWSRNGNPRRKLYLTDDKLISYSDYWDRFRDAHHQSIAITGYPTEKNFNMLKLIVGASSEEGDLVVDPFCGSGTTLNAASDLNRQWIGLDQSFEAIKATITRLRHGSNPMGDFVKKPEKPTKIVDLFSSIDNENAVKQERASSSFDFLVDAHVAQDFYEQINTLGSI